MSSLEQAGSTRRWEILLVVDYLNKMDSVQHAGHVDKVETQGIIACEVPTKSMAMRKVGRK